MAKAKKLPSGMWRCLAHSEGINKSFTAYTKREAELMALEWQEGRREKRNPANLTVDELLTQYIESRSEILSPSTIAGYRKIQCNYFTDLKLKKISKVNEIDVQREINELSASVSPKTVRNAYGLLRSACGFQFNITLPKKRKPKYRTPNVEGIESILANTAGTPVEVPVLLALWCGLRMSEIRGLKWSKVFHDHIVIDNVIVDVDGEPIEKPPKTTESERTIEISPYLYDKIMSEPHKTEYVTNLSGHAIYQRFQGLTGNVCRFHDLRHANASVMMLLNIPDAYAMRRGGWETEDIYKKTYTQTLTEGEKEAADKINTFFTDIIQHKTQHGEDKDLLQ